MTTKHYDYLLVGQGLAGSLLGYSLAKRGIQSWYWTITNNHHLRELLLAFTTLLLDVNS
jgi:folate-dependent tRNA-U54 methylase TrmFO/GidA